MIDELQREGLTKGKTWLAILDDDTRETHEELNDKRCNKHTGMFSVGGFEAPYPGYFELPADERINCRCTVVASAIDE